MNRPQAGELIHRLQIQRKRVGQTNSFGEEIEDWETIGWRYASIKPLTGREFWDAQQVKADVTHTISFRYFEGLNTAMRFLWATRAFNIGNALNLEERNEWHVCKCSEKV